MPTTDSPTEPSRFEDFVQSRLASALGIPLVAIIGLLLPELYTRQAWLPMGACLIGVVGFFFEAWRLRRGDVRAPETMVGLFVLVVVALGWTAGGLGAPALYTLAIASPLATLIGGARSGTFWLIITLFVFGVFVILHLTGQEPANHLDPQTAGRGHGIAGAALILAIAMVVIHFDRAKDKALAATELARQAAEASAQAKSDFLATMSHEIRTPMHGVLGVSSLLLNKEMSAETRKLVGIIHSSAEALLVVINDVLDFSTLEAGRFILKQEDFSITQAVDDVLALFRGDAETKGLTLNREIQADTKIHLRGDAARVRQLLLNLVGNAIKFTSEGRVDVHIKSRDTDDGRIAIRMEVSDTGPGIEAEDQKRIFERFEQVTSPRSRTHGGSGLGLAISQRLAIAMDGAISVESEPGKGATFWVELLLKPAQDQIEATHSATAETPELRRSARQSRVLLAEDHPVSRVISREMLITLGCEVDEAVTGLEALELATTGGYDIVLMDCFMPEMDGFTAARAIRALEGDAASVPIVAFTASTTAEDVAACTDAGIDDVLAKPTTVDLLEAMLTRWTPTPSREC